MTKELDKCAIVELVLFADNDFDLCMGQKRNIQKNLLRKLKRGIYDHSKAVKLWGYFAESAAKKYTNLFDSSNAKWFEVFPVAERKEASKIFADTFKTEYESGDLKHIIKEIG